ncbi:MAG TPA: MATE family efflux transporter [Planctomycetaceae bacterium]|nr:MATE family efflux transporter [Planctomycetaceae bacterium]
MNEIPNDSATKGLSDAGDLLTAPLRGTMLRLAWPVLVEQFLSFLVGFTDTYLSGWISKEATTAVGLAAYVGWLASNLFLLVSSGTVAVIARHWGAGEFEDANRAANRALALGAVVGCGVYGLIWFAAPWYAGLMKLDPGTAEKVVRFLRIDGAGYLFSCLTVAGAAALRGTGQMRVPMMILAVVNLINMSVTTVLSGVGPAEWFLLSDRLGLPKFGLDGIAYGTVIARVIGGLLTIGVLSGGQFGLKLSRRDVSLRGEPVRRILKIGLPAGFDGLLRWMGQLGFLMIIARLSDDPREQTAILAAHAIGMQVEAISFLPACAWGLASATLVGQSLGARRPERARSGGHEAVRQCGLLAVALTLFFYFAAQPIYELMHQDAQVHLVGVPAFRFNALFQVPLVVAIVYTFALQGAGEARQPMCVSFLGVFGVRLPLAYLCGIVLHGGLIGAWVGMCCDNTVRATLVAWLFRRGQWMSRGV